MNRTRALCDFLSAIDAEQIGKTNMLDIRYRLLDWLGCCLAAKDRPCAKAAAAMVCAQGGNAMSTAIGIKGKKASHEAAFYNGMISHALEYDDTNKIAITHPGAPVIAAALSAAEAYGANLETLSCGIAAGYEAMIRLGAAINPDHYEYWHTTGTCGTLAAAAACARILSLDGATMEKAMGIACTMASGLVCVFGTDAKLVTVGNAARNGLVAAELAAAGYSAPQDAFASEKGYARAARGKEDLSFMVPQKGDPLMLEDAYYKMHASCGHTHSALDALQTLMARESIDPQSIERIETLVYQKAVDLCSAYQTSTETKAKFSLPFCITCMLHEGKVTLSQFDEAHLQNEAYAAYAQRIVVREEPLFTQDYPNLRKEKVTLHMRDGRTLEEQVDLPLGHPQQTFIENKYTSLSCMSVSMETSERIRKVLMQMNEDDTLDELGAALEQLD